MEECRQVSRIFINFDVLRRSPDFEVRDTEGIEGLRRLIYPDGLVHQDACETLVREYASPEERALYIQARDLNEIGFRPPVFPRDTAADNDPPLDTTQGLGSIAARLRALIS